MINKIKNTKTMEMYYETCQFKSEIFIKSYISINSKHIHTNNIKF